MAWTTIIGSDDLAVHVGNPDWVVCDCRFSLTDSTAGRRAYDAGHIPGARYVDLDRDLAGPRTDTSGRHPLPDSAVLARRLGKWGIDEGVQVVAYDDAGGTIAARLWWLLRWLGHEAVAVLDGGWSRWCVEQRETSSALPTPQRRRFEPRPDARAWLTTDALTQLLESDAITLVDARSKARFRGEHEPIDPVAGHVPGALNRPCLDNLDRTGRMRPAAQLRHEFTRLLAGSSAPVVHMCGSGVTACHNQLAMAVAGLPASRLYVGSWSAWIRDPRRPTATTSD